MLKGLQLELEGQQFADLSRERQIAARRDLLRNKFIQIEGRIKKAWAAYKQDLNRNQPERAQIKKFAVYDELFKFLILMYDCDLLIYLNGQYVKPEDLRKYKVKIDRTRVDNFTPDLFAWFALTLGLLEVHDINEMVGYITQKLAQTVPTDAEVQFYLDSVGSGQRLN